MPANRKPKGPAATAADRQALRQRSHVEGVDEATWLDVIEKMDEVHSQLIQDEIALEEKNAQLEQSQQFIFSVLTAMSDVLVACDEAGHIEETSAALCERMGRGDSALRSSAASTATGSGRRRRAWPTLCAWICPHCGPFRRIAGPER